jgi:polysaccharide biosynthesis protein PslH
MNILLVSPNLPSPTSGASTRNYHMLRALASRHTVSLVALAENAGEGVFRDSSSLADLTCHLHIIPPPSSTHKRWEQLLGIAQGTPYVLRSLTLSGVQQTIDTLLTQERYDVAFYESSLIANYHLPSDLPVIIDQHNLEYELRMRTFRREKSGPRKWYNLAESVLLKPIELSRCRKARMVLVTSERERLLLKKVVPEQIIEVVPNGVDVAFFKDEPFAQEVEHRVIFTGTLDYYPNTDAVLCFARHCWPLLREQIPDATWFIVGKNPPAEIVSLSDLPGVTVAGSVSDIRPYITTAAVAIAPLLVGSGTRLKLLEAFAMGKAVVSTSLGCEGLAVEPSKHLLVADQPEAFARSVVSLLRDAGKRRQLGAAGRELVEHHYSWENSDQKLLQILEEVLV